MENSNHTTLVSPVSENIGQVSIESALDEIIRLNRQENTNSWRIDFSHFLFCPDETDEKVNNPCFLMKGNVWVTKTRELTKLEKAAPDLLESLSELCYEFTGEQYAEDELEKGLGIPLFLKVMRAKNAIKKASE